MQSVRWVGGREYSPRRSSVAALMQAALDRRPGTLAGCRMVYQGPHVWICREYETVRDVCVTPPEIWDRRWRLTGPDVDLAGTFVRALGPSGLAKCEGWRQTGRPYVALLSSPSVWRGSEMIAAPLAGHPAAWKAELTDNAEEFYSGLLSH